MKHIKEFFFPTLSARAAAQEIRKLTDDDRAQLVAGLTNGSYTY